MKPETLTPFERLRLANQYAILEKVDTENNEHWRKCQKIVREGYTVFYHELFDPIYDEMSREDCRYVMDVIDMHYALKHSFDALDDKGDLKEADVVFPGFSGNDETAFMSFARYLQDEHRWGEFLRGRDLNGHFPSTHRYKPMLENWEKIGKRDGIERKHRLTRDDIRAIIDEPRKRLQEANQ
jgi:uncharacterized protein